MRGRRTSAPRLTGRLPIWRNTSARTAPISCCRGACARSCYLWCTAGHGAAGRLARARGRACRPDRPYLRRRSFTSRASTACRSAMIMETLCQPWPRRLGLRHQPDPGWRRRGPRFRRGRPAVPHPRARRAPSVADGARHHRPCRRAACHGERAGAAGDTSAAGPPHGNGRSAFTSGIAHNFPSRQHPWRHPRPFRGDGRAARHRRPSHPPSRLNSPRGRARARPGRPDTGLRTPPRRARRKPLSVGALVAEAASLLDVSLPASIELVIREPAVAAIVSGEPAQLQQVILNLCNNAVQAMDGRGRIEVATEVHEVDSRAPVEPMTSCNRAAMPASPSTIPAAAWTRRRCRGSSSRSSPRVRRATALGSRR